MASRRLFLRQNAIPMAVGAITAGALLLPRTPAYADSPSLHTSKRPIYDNAEPTIAPAPIASTPVRDPLIDAPGFFATRPNPKTTSPNSTSATSPTPTDRLTEYIRAARLQLYDLSSRTEAGVNDLFTRFLHAETSFTNTIASLAPPPHAHEQLVPGLIYVLVATMTGSIVSRNRGFLLRATVPIAFGIGAGYAVIPVTMRNVGNLAWRYESRFPVVRDTHLRVQERVQSIWETGKSHAGMSLGMAEENLAEARKGIEGWVAKGK